ncbi:MAG: choline/ethanolamine kinase family protein [Candidatus Rhabdochlamydia sp.]
MNRIEARLSSAVFPSPILFEDKVICFLKKFLTGQFNIESKLISFSNENFKIREFSGNVWVLRIPNNISHCLCHQQQERAVLDWASQERFSILEVRGYDEQEGYLLTRFLTGKSCSAIDFQNPLNLREAIEILHRLHTSKTAPIESVFDPLERYVVTSQEAMQEGISFAPEIHKISYQLKNFLLQIPRDRFQQVLCHNDPSPENFFRQDGYLYLHDWELARCNDPMWDLAHFSVIGQVNLEKILCFYSTSDLFAKEKILFFQAFIFFNTLVWAAFESEKPRSSFPKESVVMLYQTFLEKINALIKSTPFETALKKLLKEQII